VIGEAGTGRGFSGLVQYLMTGKDGEHPERVGWTETRNLMTEDPELVARIMRITANVKGAGSRMENPVYHVSLSFAHEDTTDRQLETRVADRLLADLGLAEHQAFIVRHTDTDHAHLHIAVNRVHPETGKVWDNGHDWTRIEKSLRQQERELGLRAVPGHLHVLDGQERPQRDRSQSSGQRRQAERTGNAPFADRVRDVAREDLQKAGNWRELAARLAQHGLWTEKRGRGLVLTNGQEWVKASSVERAASLHALEKRLGAYQHYGQEHVAWVREQAQQQREDAGARSMRQAYREAAGRKDPIGKAADDRQQTANDNRAREVQREKDRFETRASRERAALQSRQADERIELGRQQGRARLQREQELKRYYGPGIRKEQQILKAIEERQQRGGLWYRWTRAEKDRQAAEKARRGLENATQRMEQERGKLAAEQKAEEARLLEKQRSQWKEMEEKITRDREQREREDWQSQQRQQGKEDLSPERREALERRQRALDRARQTEERTKGRGRGREME
jgi:hypothetical protein